MPHNTVNVKFAGLGGQGVIRASDILAEVAFENGLDVKKSELHGMSQRGGSVTSDVRFGESVLSPMIPEAAADFLVVLSADQVDNNRHHLRPHGRLITPTDVDEKQLPSKRSLNVALLGVLSTALAFPPETWLAVVRRRFAEANFADNEKAFWTGRQSAAGR